MTLKKVQFEGNVIFGKVFTFCSPELILSISVINGRYPDDRVVNAVILICHMFWVKFAYFSQEERHKQGEPFFAWFPKVFMS